MARDFQKWEEKGRQIIRKNERRDLSICELNMLFNDATKGSTDDILDAITKAFYIGVSVGNGIQKGAKA